MNRVNRASGFTLIELIVVIVLIGALAYFAMPRVAIAPLSLRAQAEQLASDVRYVQALSMTQGQRHCLNIDGADSYRIRNNNCSTTMAHPATGTTASIVLANASLSTTNLSVANTLEFDGRGRPTTVSSAPSCNFALTTCGGVITLAAGGETRAVRVSPETGRVVVE